MFKGKVSPEGKYGKIILPALSEEIFVILIDWLSELFHFYISFMENKLLWGLYAAYEFLDKSTLL